MSLMIGFTNNHLRILSNEVDVCDWIFSLDLFYVYGDRLETVGLCLIAYNLMGTYALQDSIRHHVEVSTVHIINDDKSEVFLFNRK